MLRLILKLLRFWRASERSKFNATCGVHMRRIEPRRPNRRTIGSNGISPVLKMKTGSSNTGNAEQSDLSGF